MAAVILSCCFVVARMSDALDESVPGWNNVPLPNNWPLMFQSDRSTILDTPEPGRAFLVIPGDLAKDYGYCFGCGTVQHIALHDFHVCVLAKLNSAEYKREMKKNARTNFCRSKGTL